MFAKDREFIDDNLRVFSAESVKTWEDDLVENYTINIMLKKPEWKKDYEKLVYEFEKVEKGLLIYPFERLHMTILGRIDKGMDPKKIVSLVESEVQGKRLGFEVGYLQNSNASIGVIAEPNFDLAALRNKLRKGMDIDGGDLTKYSKTYEGLGWFNFLRFRNKPGEKFFETLWKMRNFTFGGFEAKEIVIFRNSSKILDPGKCTEVGKVVF